MDKKANWKTFLIIGCVLSVNGVVFLALSVAIEGLVFLGVALGCLGAGIPLSVFGFKGLRRYAKQ